MLEKFLRVAVEMGADELEFEYGDSGLEVTAWRGSAGLGIGAVESNSEQSRQLVDEILALRRRKTVKVGETTYRIRVKEYDSFGEWAWRIELGEGKVKKG